MDPSTAVNWHIPRISISPAPPEEAAIEPYSPFSSTPITFSDEDAFRPRYLSPPPTLSTFSQMIRPLDDTRDAADLGQERSLTQLPDSGARRIAKTAGDLGKAIGYTNTQARRRAIFLSRVLAPPSPTATLTPKTPPDSPAIFHYTLPSPGLVSPLTHLEALGRNSTHGTISFGCKPWVEQVDFRSPRCNHTLEIDGKFRSLDAARDHKGTPSLDQISARICARVSTKPVASFPVFSSPPHIPACHELDLPVAVDELSIPIEPVKSHVATPIIKCSTNVDMPGLSKSKSTLDSRARRAYDMVVTLRRRTISTEQHLSELNGTSERSKKRHSAPADLLPFQERDGFKHPVLLLPGGF